jgi:hypothetical protein
MFWTNCIKIGVDLFKQQMPKLDARGNGSLNTCLPETLPSCLAALGCKPDPAFVKVHENPTHQILLSMAVAEGAVEVRDLVAEGAADPELGRSFHRIGACLVPCVSRLFVTPSCHTFCRLFVIPSLIVSP